MLSKVKSMSLNGLEGYLVEIETYISNGIPEFEIVGLGDTTVKEAKKRVEAAIKNSKIDFPTQKILINLAPADMRKGGSSFDLAILVGILIATNKIPKIDTDKLAQTIFIGEVSLEGKLNRVNGVLAMCLEAKELGIYLVPMPFIIGDDVLYEGVDLSQEEFYKLQREDAKITTSQPNINSIVELWEDLLKTYDQVIHIPMTSALSQSCETAESFAKNYPDKVFVVDNKRISITMKSSVFDAIKLAKDGMDGKEIKEYLENDGLNASIYLVVDTLKYLKRGGRVTPAAAAIGTVLNIKPILTIQGGKIDKFAMVTNIRSAKKKMIAALRNDIETRFQKYVQNGEFAIAVAHTTNDENAQIFKQELQEEFPNIPCTFVDPLALSIATHTGPKVLAVGGYRFYK